MKKTRTTFREEGRTPERQWAPGVLEEIDIATGKTKNQRAQPRQNQAAWELQKWTIWTCSERHYAGGTKSLKLRRGKKTNIFRQSRVVERMLWRKVSDFMLKLKRKPSWCDHLCLSVRLSFCFPVIVEVEVISLNNCSFFFFNQINMQIGFKNQCAKLESKRIHCIFYKCTECAVCGVTSLWLWCYSTCRNQYNLTQAGLMPLACSVSFSSLVFCKITLAWYWWACLWYIIFSYGWNNRMLNKCGK